jgi:hypothetical protein
MFLGKFEIKNEEKKHIHINVEPISTVNCALLAFPLSPRR